MNEKDFDEEFDLESATKAIVEKAKADVRSKYGNKKRHRQQGHMLKFLYGMLAGYLIATFEMALFIIKKGYMSVNEIPNKERELQCWICLQVLDQQQ